MIFTRTMSQMKTVPDSTSKGALTEKALIEAFILPQRRARYVELLTTARGRKTLRGRLAHISDLDPRFARRLAADSVAEIVTILRMENAPQMCQVISESDGIDGREMGLTEALDQIVGHGLGTLISCIPGKLGYYESEEPGERYLLKRA